jgi:hypothetical protein
MTIAQQLKITTFPFEIKDENGNTIYSEFSNRYWVKSEYDQDGNEIYIEDSYGDITDNRPKPEPETVLTAVEWLEKQLDATQSYWQKYYIDQAKAIEKEQIMNAYLEGESDADHYDDSALRFYNETYGGDK